MKETILCAAIYWDDGNEHPHGPTNILSGIVICGYRHGECFHSLVLMGRQASESVVQGFLTSSNRFVARTEAADIALGAGQISKKGDILISEELY